MVERDPWLTEREAATELRVSASVVRAEREAGRLGFAKLRRRVFYPLSLIDAYKASITCPAKSTSGSTLLQAGTTSHGLSGPVLSADQRAAQIMEKLSKSSLPSSFAKVAGRRPLREKSA